ncbi:hypothetical protein [Eubacterium callanderi]|uniref:hypothetical protein n=1 Tax=Eubacterium callanderi TaxID=53442 RepID=UPI001D146667|nr:hypothetical protein [Eubacterium callanderi]MCC3400227.1 hypothetical protein [Eubacterium callanderi]
MANMFKKYAADREAEQKKIEQTVSTPTTGMSADDEKRTTLSLSLTVSDKKALKMMAAERETTIAAIIHEWVAEHMQEVDK